jgi:hypothetical protein
MKRNKFFLLTTPLILVLLLPLMIAWEGLKAVPELFGETVRFPRVWRGQWAKATWF